METLPADLRKAIFGWIPDHLYGVRCVCRAWRAFVETPMITLRTACEAQSSAWRFELVQSTVLTARQIHSRANAVVSCAAAEGDLVTLDHMIGGSTDLSPALAEAAFNGQTEAMAMLLKRDAVLDIEFALLRAAEGGQLEAVKLLKENGASYFGDALKRIEGRETEKYCQVRGLLRKWHKRQQKAWTVRSADAERDAWAACIADTECDAGRTTEAGPGQEIMEAYLRPRGSKAAAVTWVRENDDLSIPPPYGIFQGLKHGDLVYEADGHRATDTWVVVEDLTGADPKTVISACDDAAGYGEIKAQASRLIEDPPDFYADAFNEELFRIVFDTDAHQPLLQRLAGGRPVHPSRRVWWATAAAEIEVPPSPDHPHGDTAELTAATPDIYLTDVNHLGDRK